NLFDFEFGGAAKYENEATEQLIVGGFARTPGKIGDTKIPRLTFAAQEPLTIQNGTIFEGSLIADAAGWRIEATYDSPRLPNLTFFFDQKSRWLFYYGPDSEIFANTYGLMTSFSF